MAAIADNGRHIDLDKVRSELEESRQLLEESRRERVELEQRLDATERALAAIRERRAIGLVGRVLQGLRVRS